MVSDNLEESLSNFSTTYVRLEEILFSKNNENLKDFRTVNSLNSVKKTEKFKPE